MSETTEITYPYYEGNILVESYEDRFERRTLTIEDKPYKIRQVETGNIYSEAIDIIPVEYTYEETDEEIEVIGEDDLQTDVVRDSLAELEDPSEDIDELIE